MELDLKALGLTEAELQDRVVTAIADRVMGDFVYRLDEDGDEWEVSETSRFAEVMERKVVERVDAAVENIAAKNVLPNVENYLENLCLQETNKWGEKTGNALTFTEYLVGRAEHYLTEKVDFEGKTKDENRGFSFKGTQTRISHLVERHLHYSIERAMNDALKTANAAIVGGIEETVKQKLKEVSDALKVELKGKR